MTTGREESDDRVVPQSRRKAVSTPADQGGGKAVTASEVPRQLGLFFETADSPQGDVAGADRDRFLPAPRAVPKSKDTRGTGSAAMTMEEVAEEGNLFEAFRHVKANDGAPGPDRQSIEEVDEHILEILPGLSRALLDETYRPGTIRRVWIPKAGGRGQRGLGIPNVIDRIVAQAVNQVMAPVYDPSFHASSHGFRPGKSCHTAIAEAKGHLEAGYEWVVDLDLANFLDRSSHYTPSVEAASKRPGSEAGTLIRKPLRRPRHTWTAWSSPRLTRCNTVCRETPRIRMASHIATYPSGASSTKRPRSCSVTRMRHGAPGVSCSPAMNPSLIQR